MHAATCTRTYAHVEPAKLSQPLLALQSSLGDSHFSIPHTPLTEAPAKVISGAAQLHGQHVASRRAVGSALWHRWLCLRWESAAEESWMRQRGMLWPASATQPWVYSNVKKYLVLGSCMFLGNGSGNSGLGNLFPIWDLAALDRLLQGVFCLHEQRGRIQPAGGSMGAQPTDAPKRLQMRGHLPQTCTHMRTWVPACRCMHTHAGACAHIGRSTLRHMPAHTHR